MGNLTIQVDAQYKPQIESVTSQINQLATVIQGKQTSINDLQTKIQSATDDNSNLQLQLNAQQAELQRLISVRGQLKPAGCKRDIGWDNSCLDSNTAAQNACNNAINTLTAAMTANNTNITSWQNQKNALTQEKAVLLVQLKSLQDQLVSLNSAYQTAMTKAVSDENATVIASATASNMPTQIANQATIDAAKASADLVLRQAEMSNDLKLQEQEAVAGKNKLYVIAGIVGVVVIVFGVVIALFVTRAK